MYVYKIEQGTMKKLGFQGLWHTNLGEKQDKAFRL